MAARGLRQALSLVIGPAHADSYDACTPTPFLPTVLFLQSTSVYYIIRGENAQILVGDAVAITR
jgi:hypothetical protein